jgi:hypothetical protein
MRHLEGNIFIKEDGGSSGSAPASGATIGSPTPYQGSGVGIKKPQAMKPRKKKENKEYDGCDCATCKELNVNCDNCPVCQANEMKDDCCSDVSKQAPCWDGYVQRGMKPGADGKPVPNCVPAEKADNLFQDSPFKMVK